MNPKVFISHGSEDKERFVTEFATRLRANGIDAWLDRWEMVPGDSLVDKIFEEGIKNATAVIVVLSSHSVDKPWVREELNAGFIKRINSNSKLIPIILDNCDVPESLKSTLWERIQNFESYDQSFARIISAITGVIEKPALGSLPTHISSPIREIKGLSKFDNLVLKSSCEHVLMQGHDLVNGAELQKVEILAAVEEQEIDDSIEILENVGILRAIRHLGPGLPHFRITTYGFQQYANVYIENYNATVQQVAISIINHKLEDNTKIAQHLGINQFLADHALDILESQNYLSLSKCLGGIVHVVNISASLRRALA